ncbi:MAG TPA: peptidase T [Candidatus Limivivens merdigallinarum]|uniref:Peptidase T n=1 Tax=Candidatus Limivivens merdigallinarum TaxID=2840859 RepID=A0A9D0ZWH8_9FIRM|nr:peptidase T [Candidatus Limivivens merdigallinarum]
MRPYERFIKYAMIPTASNENSAAVPSTQCQFNLAHVLVDELLAMGVSDARVNEKCYVYATIPATEGYEDKPAIGFIAHMDTVSDFADKQVQPVIHKNYDGGDLKLGNSGRTLEVALFPHLPSLKGRTLITSEGDTILGADDKAGVAEIMCLAEKLMNQEFPHGKICIGFTPDEEVGNGAEFFDVKGFGAEFAYTVDGGAENEIEYENFNAYKADIEVAGFNIHPGSAKDRMVNASLVAMEFNAMLPEGQTPRETEGYEGFYHLDKMSGTVEKAHLSYILRDHDSGEMERRKAVLQEIARKLNEKYGEGTVKVTLKEQYRNMKECIQENFHLIENALTAVKASGVEPMVVPIRGGTDGARLSFMGLPCPNLGTGGYAFHGPYEHITAEGMDIALNNLCEIVKQYSK